MTTVETVGTYANAARVGASSGSDIQADYALARDLFSRWFGGDARDQARDNRAAWLTSLALHGNVRAGQAILGGQGEMSGGEHDRYVKAEQYVRGEGRNDVMDQASIEGPYWSYEDAGSYPKLQAFVQGFAGVLSTAQATAAQALQAGGGVPAAVIVVGIAAAFLLLRKR